MISELSSRISKICEPGCPALLPVGNGALCDLNRLSSQVNRPVLRLQPLARSVNAISANCEPQQLMRRLAARCCSSTWEKRTPTGLTMSSSRPAASPPASCSPPRQRLPPGRPATWRRLGSQLHQFWPFVTPSSWDRAPDGFEHPTGSSRTGTLDWSCLTRTLGSLPCTQQQQHFKWPRCT
jgi:hypothetical protein